LAGHAPVPPPTVSGWLFILALCAGSVLLANFAYFAAVRRIDAAPTSVAASIEPVVGALLALFLFGQLLTSWGWIGLFMVVSGVSGGYMLEAAYLRRAAGALAPLRGSPR
ncbi:MAG: EamA family transporter, partial [Gemmatimonadetes bacterium]|nr:EamA family transporter [Gemmatimonadota bacterium]